MRPGDPRKDELGLTLVEQLFVLAMVGFMLIPVVNYLRDTRNSLMRSENSAELMRRNVRIGANLRTGLATTDVLLTAYNGGSPDLSAMRNIIKASVAASSGSPAVVAFSRSPVVENATEPKLVSPPSATSDSWGNELMYVSNLKPVTYTVCYSGCVGSPSSATVQESVSVDRLQFVYLYLAQDPQARLSSLAGGGLRLVEWRSQPYVNYGSISQFSNDTVTGKVRLSKTVIALMASGYTWAVDKDNPGVPEDAFYKLTGTGSTLAALVDNSVAAPGTLPRGSWAYVDEYDYASNLVVAAGTDGGRIARSAGSGQVAGASDIMFALNTDQPTANAAWKLNGIRLPGKPGYVPAYATPDLGLSGFPGGFEVGIFGRPSSREIVLRRVLIAVSGADRKAPAKVWPGHESVDFVSVKNDY